MKKDKKKKGIISKAKVALLAPLLSFIFTKSVWGSSPEMLLMYVAPPSPLETVSSIASFFGNILLALSALMAVIFVIAKKRKSKKKWPKILLIVFTSLFFLSLITRSVLYFINEAMTATP